MLYIIHRLSFVRFVAYKGSPFVLVCHFFYEWICFMTGLMMMAKIAKVELSEKPDVWDVLIFEVEKEDSRLGKLVSVAQTALIPTNSKQFVKQFREHEGEMVLVPLDMRSSKNGGSYLIVTGGVIDVTTLLTNDLAA